MQLTHTQFLLRAFAIGILAGLAVALIDRTHAADFDTPSIKKVSDTFWPTELPLAYKYRPEFIKNIVMLEGDENDGTCPSGVLQHLESADDVVSIAKKIRYSPECIWKTIQWWAKRSDQKIRAFAFGGTAGISAIVGYQTGTEWVISRVGPLTLMVGQVVYNGGDITLGIPGVSLTQSVIQGDCYNGIYGYLGWFDAFSALAITHAYGRYEPGFIGFGEHTHCDAIQSTRGSTTPIVGTSQVYYEQKGDFALITGPRVMPLIHFFDELNYGK